MKNFSSHYEVLYCSVCKCCGHATSNKKKFESVWNESNVQWSTNQVWSFPTKLWIIYIYINMYGYAVFGYEKKVWVISVHIELLHWKSRSFFSRILFHFKFVAMHIHSHKMLFHVNAFDLEIYAFEHLNSISFIENHISVYAEKEITLTMVYCSNKFQSILNRKNTSFWLDDNFLCFIWVLFFCENMHLIMVMNFIVFFFSIASKVLCVSLCLRGAILQMETRFFLSKSSS